MGGNKDQTSDHKKCLRSGHTLLSPQLSQLGGFKVQTLTLLNYAASIYMLEVTHKYILDEKISSRRKYIDRLIFMGSKHVVSLCF